MTLGLAPGSGGLSAAGLLFDFDPRNGNYLAFALTATGYVVMRRSDAGLEVLVMEDLDSIRADGRNRLELRADGSSVGVAIRRTSATGTSSTFVAIGGPPMGAPARSRIGRWGLALRILLAYT